MQTKTNVLVFSLAAILALSVVAMGELPQAVADKKIHDKDHEKKLKFNKKPDFESKDCIITPYASGTGMYDGVTPGEGLPDDALEVLDCKMQAWLDKKDNNLKYKIQITGMELIDGNGDESDDIDGSHIHKHMTSPATNPKGPHVLDAFENPGFEDPDVVVKPVQGIIEGIWDDGDLPTTLTSNLESLCEGKIFTAVHGEDLDKPHHTAPYLKMVLEPTHQGEKVCKKLG